MNIIDITPVESRQIAAAIILGGIAIALLFLLHRIVRVSSMDTNGRWRFLCLKFMTTQDGYMEVKLNAHDCKKAYTDRFLIKIPEYEWGRNDDDILMVSFKERKIAVPFDDEVLINLDF